VPPPFFDPLKGGGGERVGVADQPREEEEG
jgi:hypothetical protein